MNFYKKILKTTFLLCLISQCLIINSQDLRGYDYSSVDNYVLSLKKSYKNADELANDLTKNFDEDFLKARAIYRWIAEHIAYDTKSALVEKTFTFTYSTEEELEELLEKQNTDIVNTTLKKRKGVCEDYSRLFKTLCDKSGVISELVNGYAKSYAREIGKVNKDMSNHTWNAVYLNNKWYLIDVTWGSGYTDPGMKKFTKQFRSYYFLIPPEKLIFDHYPVESEWQLTSREISVEEFFKFPLVESGYFKYKIASFKPETGIINTSPDKVNKFEFITGENISNIYVHRHNNQYGDEVEFEKTMDKYSFDYAFKSRGTFYFTVFLDANAAFSYKIIVK